VSGEGLAALTKSDIKVDMRNAVRFPLKLHMAVKTASQEHESETANISAGGVLFPLDTDISVGSTIEFAITMPAAVLGSPEDVTVNCVGRVVRCGRDGENNTVAAVIDEYRFERP